jgi:hypothetical protein
VYVFKPVSATVPLVAARITVNSDELPFWITPANTPDAVVAATPICSALAAAFPLVIVPEPLSAPMLSVLSAVAPV